MKEAGSEARSGGTEGPGRRGGQADQIGRIPPPPPAAAGWRRTPDVTRCSAASPVFFLKAAQNIYILKKKNAVYARATSPVSPLYCTALLRSVPCMLSNLEGEKWFLSFTTMKEKNNKAPAQKRSVSFSVAPDFLFVVLLRVLWKCGAAFTWFHQGLNGDSPLSLLSYVTPPGFPPSVMLEMVRSSKVGHYCCAFG